MGRLGCNVDGDLNDQKFSEPMPWIGIYVAAACLACLIAMAADVIHGFRHRKFWFPCKFFSINATSLTLIGVAIKLSVDLNTPMPRRQDQLAKLSSAVFICTVMGNSMPSFGIMENEEICMNIMALAILVITVIVNICMQLATGAIFVFWKEHAAIMFLMLLLLVILSFTALTVPTIKHYLEYKYNKKYELALTECADKTDKTVVCKLRKDLIKYWMMAHTCSPQFVIGRSVTCTASGALCVLSAMILAEAMFRSYFLLGSFEFCIGDSDYKWSTTLVLITQTTAVAVGTIAPAIRWLFAIKFRCPKRGNTSYKDELFKVEMYWIQILLEMKDYPLKSRIFKLHSRRCRRAAHAAKIQFLDLCIALQTSIVVISKVIRFISIFLVSRVLICCDCCIELKKKFKFSNTVSSCSEPASQSHDKLDLSRYVLHLEGEDALVEVMMRNNFDATDHWLEKGKKREPKFLIKMLENSSKGFRGVAEFDSDQVPSLVCEEPTNSWALPVVTLTSIALALPDVKLCSRKDLICGVNEGLLYVKKMEKLLDKSAKLANIKKAAEVIWTGVDLYHKWLDVDLHKLSLQGKSPKEILEELAETAKNKFLELKNDKKACLKENPLKWPTKVLAANSMYRISCNILLIYESRSHLAGEQLFEAISDMISDILGACLTNFQQAISIKCLSSAIETREDSVRHAVFALGRTIKILKILERKALPSLETHQMASIDEWRLLNKQKKTWPFTTSSAVGDTLSSSSNDIYLAID
ncbi:hypothetical protein FEM48_Zijuj11G0058900 [Ziziphus jujuba var. spinosa]|uniref:Uncharacterized protein n=1 Tax=Ziziphus jujuba var. spinosa TaxID=714518 RepID=A0A978UH76_ZIZJJ|nr:hypothetical protein FEM48_Zijuj11G0058900 [Ziziphus jujuba var. spinosa]